MSSAPRELEAFLNRLDRLYSLPAVASQVLELTERPRVDVRQIKECIECDPALTVKLLRTVNSSVFGLSGKVEDLNQAISLLGIKPLKMLVLGFNLPRKLFRGLEEKVLGRFWCYSLTRAVAAKDISTAFWDMPGDEPFIAGLLQDLGLLVLAQDLGDPFLRFLDKIHEKRADVREIERDTMGFDHVGLTYHLLKKWNLPDILAEAIGASGSEEAIAQLPPEPARLAWIITQADILTTGVIEKRSDCWDRLSGPDAVPRRLPEEPLAKLVENLQAKVEQLAQVMSLNLPQEMEFTELLLQAHAQLSTVAEEAAAERGVTDPDRASAATGLDTSSQWEEAVWLTQAMASKHGSEPDPSTSIDAENQSEEHVALATAPVRVSPGRREIPLTSHQDLVREVAQALATCRQSREPLSLLFLEIGGLDESGSGSESASRTKKVLKLLETACQHTAEGSPNCLRLRPNLLGVLLPGHDRPHVTELGQSLVRLPETLGARGSTELDLAATHISGGAATIPLPPKNFPASQLIESAERCLQAANLAGVGTLKSIGIY